jgi:5-methylthioadenosine/S-adenosylhomocysteine deaminase
VIQVNVDALIVARWIIPVVPDNHVYENHALVINDGIILDILPTQLATEKYQALATHNLPGHALIPGLINAHTHAAMSLFKGLADDLALMDWLNNHIWPAETKWVDAQFVEDGTRLAIAEMLRGGTTCFNDMYFFPDRTAEVAIETGIRASIGLIVIDFPTAWAKDTQEYFDKGEQVHDKFRHNPLIRTAFAPHAPYTVSDMPLQKIAVLAEELDVPIHMHIHENAFEVTQSLEQHGITPLERLAQMGLLSQRLLAVHMTQLDEQAIELVARYNVNVIHCPESNLKLASGFAPIHALQQAGVNVALGTDGSASNNDLDMLGEMRTAALIGKGISGNSQALSAMTVLKMATINAARALDQEKLIGSLETGKQADITAIDLDAIETQPVYDPISHIVYAASRSQVSDVWVAGKQLLRNRELLTIDEPLLRQKTQVWQDRIAKTS